MATEKRLIVLADDIDALNSEGITKNMRAHRKVAALPTVDAVEVVHGRYIPDMRYRGVGNCSLCGGDVTILNNYCPNCGAKMGW